MSKKSILITGGTGNLGKAVVEKFNKQHHVIALVRKIPKQPIEHVVYYETDLTNASQTTEVIQSIIKDHTIQAAILTTGGYRGGTLSETSGEDIDKLIDLNFYTTYNVVRPLFEHMKLQNNGRIILTGARPAIQPKDGTSMVGYTLAKSMLITLAEILNAAGKSHNVITSVIIPGTIDTPENREAMPNANTANWVKPDSIAAIIDFLCSSQADPLRDPIIKVWGNS